MLLFLCRIPMTTVSPNSLTLRKRTISYQKQNVCLHAIHILWNPGICEEPRPPLRKAIRSRDRGEDWDRRRLMNMTPPSTVPFAYGTPSVVTMVKARIWCGQIRPVYVHWGKSNLSPYWIIRLVAVVALSCIPARCSHIGVGYRKLDRKVLSGWPLPP